MVAGATATDVPDTGPVGSVRAAGNGLEERTWQQPSFGEHERCRPIAEHGRPGSAQATLVSAIAGVVTRLASKERAMTPREAIDAEANAGTATRHAKV